MTRGMHVAIAVGILGTARGLSFPSTKGAAEKIERVFRGLRASSKNAYCDSIGCPDGYTPIANADEVECWGNTCEASQCCEASCSYHPCPTEYVLVEDAENVLCDNNGCTTYLCLRKREKIGGD